MTPAEMRALADQAEHGEIRPHRADLASALRSAADEIERLESQCDAWMRKRDRAYAERDLARASASATQQALDEARRAAVNASNMLSAAEIAADAAIAERDRLIADIREQAERIDNGTYEYTGEVMASLRALADRAGKDNP